MAPKIVLHGTLLRAGPFSHFSKDVMQLLKGVRIVQDKMDLLQSRIELLHEKLCDLAFSHSYW